MSTGDATTAECSRCEEAVPISDAAMLVQERNKALWRIMCPDCLADIGVPKGYTIKRDIAHLFRDDTAQAPSVTHEDPNSDSDRSIVADFSAQVVTSEMAQSDLTPGRVVMDDRGLVLATQDHRTEVPLAGIHDIRSGEGSETTREFFDDVLRIRYRKQREQGVAYVAGSRETLDRFEPILFTSLLNGTGIRFRHPTNVGGQPRAPSTETGGIAIQNGEFRIAGTDVQIAIDRDSVVDVRRVERDWCQSDASVLRITTDAAGRAVASELALPSVRVGTLLASYFHGRYGTRTTEVADMDLSTDELRFLVRLFTLGADAADAGDHEMGNADPESLQDAGLIDDADGTVSLTKTGQVAVFRRFDETE